MLSQKEIFFLLTMPHNKKDNMYSRIKLFDWTLDLDFVF